MGEIKAIETEYNGYRFRSRLEARWAVFFDALDIPYYYEPEGFDLDGMRYLPDFYLPDIELWVEVKGHLESEEEKQTILAKMHGLTKNLGHNGVIVIGNIWPSEYWTIYFWWSKCYCPDCSAKKHLHIREHPDGEIPLDSGYLRQLGVEIDGRLIASSTTVADCMPKVMEAYQAARQARFEHGEKGI